MERLALTDDQIKRFENATHKQAQRVWDFTLIIGDLRISIEPLSYDREFNFDKLWNDIYIEGLIDPVIYDNDVFPNRRHLEMEITYDYRLALGDTETDKLKPVTVVYEVALLDVKSKALENNGVQGTQPLRYGDTNRKPIKVKVVDPHISQYRLHTVSGIFHEATLSKVMYGLLRPGITPLPDVRQPVLKPKPYYAGTYEGIVGCQIVPPDNANVYPQVLVEFDVKLMELPEYLQENYGLYENGIASCIDRGIVYVFPVTDWSRYKNEERTLTITNADPASYAGLETTYHVDDRQKVEIIATKNIKHEDASDIVQLNAGLGAVWINADEFLDGGINYNPADDTIYANRSAILVSTSSVERSDGLTQKRWSTNRVTANKYVEESRERMKRTSRLIVGWDNSNPDVLYPGMPTRFRTQIGEKLVEVDGTLLGTHTVERRAKEGLTSRNFSSVTYLSILIPSLGI